MINLEEQIAEGSSDVEYSTIATSDIPTSTNADTSLNTYQIVFVVLMSSLAVLLIVGVFFVYICVKHRPLRHCYGPVNYVRNENDEEDDTLYMVDYDQVAIDQGRLTINFSNEKISN